MREKSQSIDRVVQKVLTIKPDFIKEGRSEINLNAASYNQASLTNSTTCADPYRQA